MLCLTRDLCLQHFRRWSWFAHWFTKMMLTVQSFAVVFLVPVWVLFIDVIPLMEPFSGILFWMSLNWRNLCIVSSVSTHLSIRRRAVDVHVPSLLCCEMEHKPLATSISVLLIRYIGVDYLTLYVDLFRLVLDQHGPIWYLSCIKMLRLCWNVTIFRAFV